MADGRLVLFCVDSFPGTWFLNSSCPLGAVFRQSLFRPYCQKKGGSTLYPLVRMNEKQDFSLGLRFLLFGEEVVTDLLLFSEGWHNPLTNQGLVRTKFVLLVKFNHMVMFWRL